MCLFKATAETSLFQQDLQILYTHTMISEDDNETTHRSGGYSPAGAYSPAKPYILSQKQKTGAEERIKKMQRLSDGRD